MTMNWLPRIVWGLTGGHTINLPYPPDGDPLGESNQADTTEFTSNSGKVQTQYNYTAQTFTLTFSFLDLATVTLLRAFYNQWAQRGKTFTYYPSRDTLSTGMTLFLVKKEFKLVRQLADGNGDFLYKLTWTFQRNKVGGL